MTDLSLGKLERVHGIAPAFLQRAMFVAALSFVCFMAMLIGFYIRQNVGYFLLSTAFLIVYILTMFGWLMLRKSVVNIYENGITYKKFAARWDEIAAANANGKRHFEIIKKNGEKITLNETIEGLEQIRNRIEREISGRIIK